MATTDLATQRDRMYDLVPAAFLGLRWLSDTDDVVVWLYDDEAMPVAEVTSVPGYLTDLLLRTSKGGTKVLSPGEYIRYHADVVRQGSGGAPVVGWIDQRDGAAAWAFFRLDLSAEMPEVEEILLPGPPEIWPNYRSGDSNFFAAWNIFARQSRGVDGGAWYVLVREDKPTFLKTDLHLYRLDEPPAGDPVGTWQLELTVELPKDMVSASTPWNEARCGMTSAGLYVQQDSPAQPMIFRWKTFLAWPDEAPPITGQFLVRDSVGAESLSTYDVGTGMWTAGDVVAWSYQPVLESIEASQQESAEGAYYYGFWPVDRAAVAFQEALHGFAYGHHGDVFLPGEEVPVEYVPPSANHVAERWMSLSVPSGIARRYLREADPDAPFSDDGDVGLILVYTDSAIGDAAQTGLPLPDSNGPGRSVASLQGLCMYPWRLKIGSNERYLRWIYGGDHNADSMIWAGRLELLVRPMVDPARLTDPEHPQYIAPTDDVAGLVPDMLYPLAADPWGAE